MAVQAVEARAHRVKTPSLLTVCHTKLTAPRPPQQPSYQQSCFGGSFTTNFQGSVTGAFADGWTVTGGNIDWIYSLWQAPPGCDNSIDLNGGTKGTISRSFSTVAFSTYTLFFAVSELD